MLQLMENLCGAKTTVIPWVGYLDVYSLNFNRMISATEVIRNKVINMIIKVSSFLSPKYPAAFSTEYKIIEKPIILKVFPSFLFINRQIPPLRQMEAISISEKT